MLCIDFDREMMILKKWKNRIGRRVTGVLLCLTLGAGAGMPFPLTAAAQGGTCGSSTTWDYSNGVLTISGTGAADYIPWIASEVTNGTTSIVIGDGVTSLANRPFSGLKKVTSVKFGKSMTTIPSNVCSGMSSLKTVTFSEGTQIIGKNAFQNCYELGTVKLPSSLQTIENNAFYACLKMTEITIPDSVKSIGDTAFKANNVTKLHLGSNLETIGKEAFGMSCFSEAEIPDTVKSIGAKAFGIVCSTVTHSGSTLNYSYSTSPVHYVTIIGKANGTAQQYAQSENLPFKVAGEEAHTHSWSAWTTKTAAGCETAGVQIRTCSGCGETETKEIPATGHHMSDWKTEKAAGCETEGLQVRTCSGCDKKETQIIPASGHQMSDWKIEKAAGCETEGQNVRTCAVCGKKEYQTVPATGHTWGEWKITKQPTVDSTGEQESVCASCGAVRTNEVAKLVGYTVSVSSNEGGSVTPSGETKVAEGGSLTLSVRENAGYQLVSVLVNGSERKPDSSGSLILSDIRANQTVSVVFQKKVQPKTRSCNFVDVTPQRKVWLTDESAVSMQDFKIYANITDNGTVSWLDITADCVPEASGMPKAEPYGTGTVTFRYQGSDAEVKEYLAQNSITGQIPLYLRGDGDLNGIVDVVDAEIALGYYVKQIAGAKSTTLSEAQCEIMDVDSNGITTLEDAAYILKYYTRQMAHMVPDWQEIFNRKG